jgi:hypothetical protein
MCESKAEGGLRCAAHTRPAYQTALTEIKEIPQGEYTAPPLQKLFAAAVEYASTPSGQTEVAAAVRTEQGMLAELLADAAARGRVKLTAHQVANMAARNRKNLANRLPQSQVTPAGWKLSRHVLDQAAVKDITLDQLIACADKPDIAYQSSRYKGQMKHVKGGICLALDPATKTVITVFIDRVYTDVREDQTDADARRYAEKRAAERNQ